MDRELEKRSVNVLGRRREGGLLQWVG